jgi:hypothetical protein
MLTTFPLENDIYGYTLFKYVPATVQMSDTGETLKKKGLIENKKQVSAYGTLLMDILSKDPELVDLRKMDETLLYEQVKGALRSIKEDSKDAAALGLLKLADILKLRYLLGSLHNDPDSDAYETLSFTLKEYSKALSRYNTLDRNDKKYIMNDLKRDLGALMEYAEEIRGEKLDVLSSVPIYYEQLARYVQAKPEKLKRAKVMYYHFAAHWDERVMNKYIKSSTYASESDICFKKPLVKAVTPYITTT